jgi:hypothetical protein
MILSIILGIVLTIVWCIVSAPFVSMALMPFIMAGGAPGLTNKEKYFMVAGYIGILLVAYIAVPVLIFFLIL